MEKLAMHGGGAASGRLLGYGRQTIDEDARCVVEAVRKVVGWCRAEKGRSV